MNEIIDSDIIPATQLKNKIVLIHITPDEEKMIEHLKGFAKSKSRTKAVKFAIEKAYGIYKDAKP